MTRDGTCRSRLQKRAPGGQCRRCRLPLPAAVRGRAGPNPKSAAPAMVFNLPQERGAGTGVLQERRRRGAQSQRQLAGWPCRPLPAARRRHLPQVVSGSAPQQDRMRQAEVRWWWAAHRDRCSSDFLALGSNEYSQRSPAGSAAATLAPCIEVARSQQSNPGHPHVWTGCGCCASLMPAMPRTCTHLRAPVCGVRPPLCWCVAVQHSRGSVLVQLALLCQADTRQPACLTCWCVWHPTVQDWCRANAAECLAVQPPGRNTRSREAPITTCRELAAALLPVVASRLLDAPYVVSGSDSWSFAALACVRCTCAVQCQCFWSARTPQPCHFHTFNNAGCGAQCRHLGCLRDAASSAGGRAAAPN